MTTALSRIAVAVVVPPPRTSAFPTPKTSACTESYAIAHISVRHPNQKSLLLGSKSRHHPGKIPRDDLFSHSLVIVPQATLNHVQDMWDIMKRIADVYHKDREAVNKNDPALAITYNGPSPPPKAALLVAEARSTSTS
jgi:hypothetical protein